MTFALERMDEQEDDLIHDLKRVLRSAIITGYHTCDEKTPAIDEPHGGCRCWCGEGKILLNIENELLD